MSRTNSVTIGVVLYGVLSFALLLDQAGPCHAFTSHHARWGGVKSRGPPSVMMPLYSTATRDLVGKNPGRAQTQEKVQDTSIYGLMEKAMSDRSKAQGLHAFDRLGDLYDRRRPYKFVPRTTSKQGMVLYVFLSVAARLDRAAKDIRSTDVETVLGLTGNAIRYRGEPKGLHALDRLGEMCERRLPYQFVPRATKRQGSVISHVPGLLPKEITAQVYARVMALEEKGHLSTNPDSVDGLPSFHLNLVSDGSPVCFSPQEGDHDEDALCEIDEFSECMHDLLALVKPYVYDELLPKVNQMMNTTSIRVGDVFLRRYGQDLIDDKSRKGISAHYDVFSKVTSVIALDDIAVEGRNGLFTTQVSPIDGKTSNHAALRRFFPLACGDAVVHTWDVLHGVDVEPGLDRTSLIVWFTTEEELDPEESLPPSPWLHSQPDLETNDVAQFVLGSAIESSAPSFSQSSSLSLPKAMIRPDPSTCDLSAVSTRHPFDLYLDSAARENAFALTRFGNLCEDGILDESMTKRATDLAKSLRSESDLPEALLRDDDLPSMGLAKRFWFEGSIRGNLLAQMALADEIMFEAKNRDDADARLLSATLFGLAAQQGNEQAVESLRRVAALDIAASEYDSDEDFLNSPIIRIAETACRL